MSHGELVASPGLDPTSSESYIYTFFILDFFVYNTCGKGHLYAPSYLRGTALLKEGNRVPSWITVDSRGSKPQTLSR